MFSKLYDNEQKVSNEIGHTKQGLHQIRYCPKQYIFPQKCLVEEVPVDCKPEDGDIEHLLRLERP
jgi:hypothetical protein